MNFINVLGLLFLLSISNCASTNNGKQDEPDKNVKMNEIILYIDAATQMTFEEESFSARMQEHADTLNTLLEGKQAKVRTLGGKKTISKTDTIFYLTVDEKYSEKLVKDLLALTFVNGAYIKPEAEEPGEGSP